MIRRLLKLAYLIAQHPFHAHRWFVDRGLVQRWVKDFAMFWDTVRPPGLPITDYTSYRWLEYHFAQRFRERYPEDDHFDDKDAQYARLLSYVLRRERHPLRCLMQAWHLRRCKTVLEFGAGAAPYAHFIATAWPWRQRVSTVDVPSLLRDYQVWNQFDNIWSLTYDGIVCTEVFEHLPDPVDSARDMMNTAPRICFDYVNDGSQRRLDTFELFIERGTLIGPDARGLYVWTRATD